MLKYGTKEISTADEKIVRENVETLLVHGTKHMNELINYNGTVDEFLKLVDDVQALADAKPVAKKPAAEVKKEEPKKEPTGKSDQPVI